VRQEVDNLRRMGVEFETTSSSQDVPSTMLMQAKATDAVFVCTGADCRSFLNIPGEHLNGVYSANDS